MQTAIINAEKINITSTLKDKINIVFELTKLRITFFITLTTILGFISFTGRFTEGIIAPVIGIMLLSSGSAVINHYQERNTDALMARTKRRPIPSGKISSTNALKFAIILVLSGSIVLILGTGLKTLALGLLNLFWYNLIYTPLKRKNALAIVPGSLVGALPPMIGWVSAGGNLTDPRILILSFFFFIWQIPHFWLLLLIFGKDYEQAGFPTLTQVFNLDQLSRITFIWIMATVVTCMLIPMFGIVKNIYIVLALLTAGLWLSWNAVKLLKVTDKKILFRFAFKEINLFAVYVVLILSINQLLI
jgi:protoheme IX farnesyltransferase